MLFCFYCAEMQFTLSHLGALVSGFCQLSAAVILPELCHPSRFTDLCRLAASLGGLTVISGLDAVWVEHVLVC